MTAASPPGPTRDSFGQAAFLEAGGRTVYLAHGRRVTLGSSKSCNIVLGGPGVERKHARLSMRLDGRIFVKPLGDSGLRIGLDRVKGPVVIDPGQVVGIGLATVKTGAVENNLHLQLRLACADLSTLARRTGRRAPWFLLSLVLHGFLLMLLFAAWTRPGGSDDSDGHVLLARTDTGTEADDLDDELVEPPLPEVDEPDVPEPDLPDDMPAAADEDEEDPGEAIAGAGADGGLDALAKAALDDVRRGRGAGPAKKVPAGVSPKFAKTIAKLRKTGLEVAFLVDSTASMGRLLTDAKQDLRDIFTMFEELVPSTRMALVTYRDHGDAYLTRKTRLGVDHYEALAFLSSVRAEGGGDFEEAVDAALLQARKLHWRSRTRKIIVLVGDAPPHRGRNLQRCIRLAKQLVRRNGQVHCLVVGNEGATWQAMRQIAKAGTGRCLARAERDQLARQLLGLALGPDSGADLEKLLAERAATSRRRRLGPRTARLPAPAILARTLSSPRPDAVIVEAWTWAEPRMLALLPGRVAGVRLSREGLQALYYIANRALERQGGLSYEPILPPTGRRLAKGLPRDLRRRLQQLRPTDEDLRSGAKHRRR